MAEFQRDVRDTRDRMDTAAAHHSVAVPTREVTNEAVSAARAPAMVKAEATTKNYFGSLQIHDGNGNPYSGNVIEQPSTKFSSAARSSGTGSSAAKTDAPKADDPKSDPPKPDAPRADAPKTDTPKTDTPTAPPERHDGPADKGDREAARADRIESRKIADRILTKEPGVSDKFYNDLKDSLSGLPSKDLAAIEKAGIKVRAVKNIENRSPGVFDGKTVRLAENADVSFADGTFEKMGKSEVARNETTAHEIGHALSFVRGGKKQLREHEDSSDRGFKAAHAADVKAGWRGTKSGDPIADKEARGFYKYHANEREEAYAQTYAMESGLASPEHQRAHRQQFPKASEWMRRRNQEQ